jgi:anaerobic magnesium-protoporphyrin IX monomethyl ester cyclase
MKVLFIDPPGYNPPSTQVRRGNLSHAIARLGAQLIDLGHEVSLLDMMNHFENLELKSVKKAMDSFNPDLVCFSMLSVQYHNATESIKWIKDQYGCPIVAGGTGVVCAGEQIFEDCDFKLDIAVLGEGEPVLPEIVKNYEQGEPGKNQDIAGLLFNQNGTITNTGIPEVVQYPDDYPFENLDLFGVKSMGVYEVMASRGCIFNCSFCFNHAGHSMRNRAPEKIVEELVAAKSKYNFNKFRFVDAFLNNDKKWLIEVCRHIKSSELRGIPWEANGIRADHLDDELCEAMVGAGCEMVGIGVESLHPVVYKKVRKGTPLKTLESGISIAVKHFPRVISYMIIGLEDDTLSRTLYSYKRIKKLKTNHLLYCMALPFPGTRLEKYAKEHGKILRGAEDSMLIFAGDEAQISFETPEFTLEERKTAFKIIMVKEFRYIAWTTLKYLPGLWKWFKLALRYDTLRITVHLYKIWEQHRKLQRLYKKPQTFNDYINYERIPDGTWGISINKGISKYHYEGTW